MILGINLWMYFSISEEQNREYRIQINRAFSDIEKNGFHSLSLEKYPAITEAQLLEADAKEEEVREFYKFSNQDSVIMLRETMQGNEYIKFIYKMEDGYYYRQMRLTVNTGMGIMAAAVIILWFYIRSRIFKPFHEISDFPYELSKGHLTKELNESPNRFFGKFLWGLNMLRENLENHKTHELELIKEKKTLILSISHDIKTPLSAIKLYAKALERNLYVSEEKQKEVALHIEEKANEIEKFISQIVSTTKEDFLHMEVENGEFYLDNLICRLQNYYLEKFDLLKIEFEIEPYDNCLLKGDIERVLEVLENVIENAIKYGDGKKLEIAFSKEEDCQLITIKNTGNTLPSTESIHMFESFYRGFNAIGIEGSGLGLYICRQLMNKMGGEIFAKPKEDGMSVSIVIQML